METQTLRRYIVTLKKGVDYDSFYHDMETVTDNIPHIPNRAVAIATWLPHSSRNTFYLLTDAEAYELKNDSRVLAVVFSIEGGPDDVVVPSNIQTSNFDRPTNGKVGGGGSYKNWGLLRCAFPTNMYGTGVTPSTSNYAYHLDGTGVDYIVNDSGIELDHPEFQDANGINRIQQIDWLKESLLDGVDRGYKKQSSLFYRDVDGHGTHVASTSVGKTFGWAKNARIYLMKINTTQPDYEIGTKTFTGYTSLQGMAIMRQWHENKPVDTVTGKKRPTVVNMSWSIGTSAWPAGLTESANLGRVTGGMYRGVSWTKSTIDTAATLRDKYDLRVLTYYALKQSIAFDAELDDLVDAGVHVCVAAGNDDLYSDISTGASYNDYCKTKYENTLIAVVTLTSGSTVINNPNLGTLVKVNDEIVLIPMPGPNSYLNYTHDTIYYKVTRVVSDSAIEIWPPYDSFGVVATSVFLGSPIPIYYHRTGSPYSDKSIRVGNVDSKVQTATLERANTTSNKGPFVDIWAPGTNITAAWPLGVATTNISSTSALPVYAYNENKNYKQRCISGTSMASPQVAGVVALYLQLNPDATPAETKQFIINSSVKNAMYNAGPFSYTDLVSIRGGPNRLLYFPYANDNGLGADVTLTGEGGNANNLKIAPIAYTYDNWAADYRLTNQEKLLGINIANLLYLSKVKLGFQYPLTFHGTLSGSSAGLPMGANTTMIVHSDASPTNAGLTVGMVITKTGGTGAFGGGNTTTISSVTSTGVWSGGIMQYSVVIQSSATNTIGTVDFNVTLDVYGLNRKPDAVSLEYWTRRCLKTNPAYINPGDTWTAGDYNSTAFKKAFCDAIQAGGPGADFANFFFPLSYQGGYWTNGDFIDKGILP